MVYEYVYRLSNLRSTYNKLLFLPQPRTVPLISNATCYNRAAVAHGGDPQDRAALGTPATQWLNYGGCNALREFIPHNTLKTSERFLEYML